MYPICNVFSLESVFVFFGYSRAGRFATGTEGCRDIPESEECPDIKGIRAIIGNRVNMGAFGGTPEASKSYKLQVMPLTEIK